MPQYSTFKPNTNAPLLIPDRALSSRDTIHCCDNLDLLRALGDNSIDMILTSPPYDNLRTYKGYSWQFEPLAHQMYRVLKPGGVAVWVVGDSVVDGSETLSSFEQALYFKNAVGFRCHDTMIWEKYLPGVYGKRYVHAFEYMFVLSKEEPKAFNPLKRPNISAGRRGSGSQRYGYQTQNGHIRQSRIRYVYDESILENVWKINNFTQLGPGHPAAFPEELAHRHIATWSNPGDLVLDPFMGSGTTAKIARNLGRHYIGCDISAEYVALANRRLADTDPYQPTQVAPGVVQQSLFAGLAS